MEADHVLVERAKQGELKAFSELVYRHQKSLLRLAYRVVGDLETAQDVVQESFMKAYQKISAFEGRSAFKSWIFQITLNTAKNKLRGRRPEFVDIEKASLSDKTNLEADLMSGDLKILVQTEINRLPDRQRMALSLRIFDDLSFAEIAEVMKCPYDTAKANYRHALIKMRQYLGEQQGMQLYLKDNQVEHQEVDA